MINITINISDVNDAITMREDNFLNTIRTLVGLCIQNGARVVFEQRFENAEPKTISIISSNNELERWEEKRQEVQNEINKIIESRNR